LVLDSDSEAHSPNVVARGVNIFVIALVLGGLVYGGFVVAHGVRNLGNEGAAASSQVTPQTLAQPATNASHHSRRRFELLAAGVVGGALLVGFATLSAIDASRRRRVRRAAHWRL
jgi:hypothetical protein